METRFAPALVGGRYRVEGLLGQGGMARVFDAFDEQLERPVAVKVLRAETQSIAGMRQRFQQEALIAARLIHPNIVAVLDFGEEGATSYLVMERLPGTTLRDEIVARGPLSPSRVALVMAETLSGLSAAHRFGVLHRDVKPSNILLQGDGHTKITDFGIAKSFDSRNEPDWMTDERTVTGFVLGTPGYLAPERRSGCPATVQSDLYAVGAVMVEALTGQRLGPGPAPCAQLAPPLRDVARRALATNPRDRFTSAREMLQAVQSGTGPLAPAVRVRTSVAPAAEVAEVAATATIPARADFASDRTATLTALHTPPGSLSRSRTRVRSGTRRRRNVVALVAAIAVLALAGGAVFLLHAGRQPTRAAVSPARHSASRPHTQALTRTTHPAVDAEGTAIRSLALSLDTGGLPGDGALAAVLEAAAAQAPGTARRSSAEQALSLAQVLLDGGGISSRQYQAVVSILQPTGATVTTTTAAPPTPGPAPGPLFQDHGHGHGHGEEQGSNG